MLRKRSTSPRTAMTSVRNTTALIRVGRASTALNVSFTMPSRIFQPHHAAKPIATIFAMVHVVESNELLNASTLVFATRLYQNASAVGSARTCPKKKNTIRRPARITTNMVTPNDTSANPPLIQRIQRHSGKRRVACAVVRKTPKITMVVVTMSNVVVRPTNRLSLSHAGDVDRSPLPAATRTIAEFMTTSAATAASATRSDNTVVTGIANRMYPSNI